MRFFRKLPDAEELKCRLSLDHAQKEARIQRIREIQKILEGKSEKKIL